MPGSIDGSPCPACAAAWCRSRERERPAQWLQFVAHAVWRSGLTAISWRSAFCVITEYCLRFQDSVRASESAFWAKVEQRGVRRLRQVGVIPECERAVDERRGVVRLRRLAGIERIRLQRVLRDPPAATPRCRVEPARVVPAGDVRRVEELLPGHAAEPRPRRRVDAAAEPAQKSGRVDRRRLHEAATRVERGVLEDRGDDRLDGVSARDVEMLERARVAASGAPAMK